MDDWGRAGVVLPFIYFFCFCLCSAGASLASNSNPDGWAVAPDGPTAQHHFATNQGVRA